MAQAKTLTKQNLKQLVDVTNSCSRYAARDATMLLFTHFVDYALGKWRTYALLMYETQMARYELRYD